MTSTAHATKRTGYYVVMLVVLGTGVAVADAPESSIEELFLSENAYTQEAGETQLSLGADFADTDDLQRTGLSLELEYGLSDRVQVSLGVPYTLHEDGAPDGEFGELEAGVGVRLWGTDRQIVSFALEVGFPTGSEEPGEEDDVEWEPGLFYGAALGGIELHAGVGAELESGESELNYHAAMVMPGRMLSTVVESTISDDETYLLAGVVVDFSAEGQLNLGVPVGLGRSSGDWGVLLAATWEF